MIIQQSRVIVNQKIKIYPEQNKKQWENSPGNGVYVRNFKAAAQLGSTGIDNVNTEAFIDRLESLGLTDDIGVEAMINAYNAGLSSKIRELTAQRDELMKNEKANRDEIVKLNNRIGILRDRLEKHREQVVSLKGKLRRRDARVDRLTEQMKEARNKQAVFRPPAV